MPIVTASKHHAVTSPTAAQVIAVIPIRVCCMLRSVRMRARTGKAVTDSESPKNIANTLNGTSAVESRG